MKVTERLGLFWALLMMLVVPAVVQAQDFAYTTNSDNTITIAKYKGNGGTVTIPNTLNGLPVTSIGNGAFWNAGSLTGVTIPNRVTSIGEGAFQNCLKLTSVTIPDSVTSIGDRAFLTCGNLTNVTIGTNVTSIGKKAFCGTSLISVTIPASVTFIGDEAFSSCSSLASLTIPKTVRSVGSRVQGNMETIESRPSAAIAAPPVLNQNGLINMGYHDPYPGIPRNCMVVVASYATVDAALAAKRRRLNAIASTYDAMSEAVINGGNAVMIAAPQPNLDVEFNPATGLWDLYMSR